VREPDDVVALLALADRLSAHVPDAVNKLDRSVRTGAFIVGVREPVFCDTSRPLVVYSNGMLPGALTVRTFRPYFFRNWLAMRRGTSPNGLR
jgi:hypothetical protein